MSRRPVLLRVAVVILVTLGLVGASAVAPAAAPAEAASTSPSAASSSAAAPSEYVALGDSYAAGYGLADLTKQPVAACSQSGLDYPHRVATSLGLTLTDVSCAGATTANVVDTKQSGAAPQIDALSKDTKLVTISIGGNDAGLFSTASSCIALSKTGPIFGAASSVTNCRSEHVVNGRDDLKHAIETTTARGLRTAFAAIRQHAPNAAVVVVGYPAVFPDAAHTPASGCYRPVVDASALADGFPKDGFPFTDVDVAYLSSVQATLDSVTARAAKASGVTYVSTLEASEAHSGCVTSGSYISGISLTASEYFRSISLTAGALHPNARGVAYLAATTTAAARTALAPTPSAQASTGASATRSPGVIGIGALAVLVLALALILVVSRSRRRRASRDRG